MTRQFQNFSGADKLLEPLSSKLSADVDAETMAKQTTSDKLAIGARARVVDGVHVPDFPDVSCTGWTGVVRELMGKKSDPKYLVEWDDETVAGMPETYREECEQQQVYFAMACMERPQIEPVEE